MTLTVGGLSVMIGAGGTIGVPLLTACNFPVQRAVETAADFSLLIALPEVITLTLVKETPADAAIGTWRLVNLTAFLLIIPLTILVALVGVKIGSVLA